MELAAKTWTGEWWKEGGVELCDGVVADADVTDLAFRFEPCQLADCLGDGNCRVGSMVLIQVDCLHSETLQGSVTGRA